MRITIGNNGNDKKKGVFIKKIKPVLENIVVVVFALKYIFCDMWLLCNINYILYFLLFTVMKKN